MADLLSVSGFLAAACAGTGAGILTGLIPGVHVNTLAPVALAYALGTGDTVALYAAVFLLATAVAHTVTNVIPALAAPIPDDATALAILPLQRLAREGHAVLALRVAVRASWSSGIMSSLAILALLAGVSLLRPGASLPAPSAAFVASAVTLIVVLLIIRHPRPGRSLATLLVAGLAGVLLLPLSPVGPLGTDGNILLPAFTGLFAAPLLIATISERGGTQHTDQGFAPHEAEARAASRGRPTRTTTGAMIGAACGFLVALFPGLTSATAASLGRGVRPPKDDLEEVALVAATDTANVVANTAALLVWGAVRSGAGAAAATLVPGLAPASGVARSAAVLAALLVAILGSALFAMRAGPRLVTHLRALPPRVLACATLGLLVGIIGALNGPLGLLAAAAVLPLGYLPHAWRVPRALLMGFLLVPYLGSAHGLLA